MAYRESVRMWYDCVQASAESGYSKAKGIAGNLGYTLFTKMEPRYKQTIQSAIKSGKLRLRRNADGTKFTEEQHVKCVETMLDLVAKEYATYRVRRVISLGKEVYTCKRRANETYREFGDRFEGVARTYLSYAHVTPNAQDEQHVAMILIENANVPTSTYNTILNNLVTGARKTPLVKNTTIPVEDLTYVKFGYDALRLKLEALVTSTDSTQNISTAVTLIMQDYNMLASKLQSLGTSAVDVTNNNSIGFTITLDQATEELSYIKTSEKRKSEKDLTVDDDATSADTVTVTPVLLRRLER